MLCWDHLNGFIKLVSEKFYPRVFRNAEGLCNCGISNMLRVPWRRCNVDE